MKIYKYKLEITDEQVIPFPVDQIAIPLSVAEQRGELVLWAFVSTHSDMISSNELYVRIIGTGNPITDEINLNTFVGTVVMSNGLVWHVFSEYRCR